jgi:hypothetical protein
MCACPHLPQQVVRKEEEQEKEGNTDREMQVNMTKRGDIFSNRAQLPNNKHYHPKCYTRHDAAAPVDGRRKRMRAALSVVVCFYCLQFALMHMLFLVYDRRQISFHGI